MSYRATGTSTDPAGPERPGLRRWSARTASVLVISAAAVFPSIGPAFAVTGHQRPARPAAARLLLGQRIAAYAQTFVGRYPYKWGGNSPLTGFDCSGLTSYIYRQYGMAIPRTAEAQYLAFRKVRTAWRGDLVFFHDKTGYVYHVGIYEGNGTLVAAADKKEGITFETVWDAAATFGTITHN
jgi:cell wall-associated NlpC family hydrolase